MRLIDNLNMNKNRTRSFVQILLAILIVAGWSVFSPVAAENYVSFNGKFRITIPAEWARADYQTVDYWLSQSQSEKSDYDYEAVFTPRDETAFAQGDYLILTVDTVGALDNSAIDSILTGMYDIFGDDLKYSQEGNLATSLQSGEPTYDSKSKTALIVSDLIQPDNTIKKSLLVMKFYEHGIASFYFYSPDSTWESNQMRFVAVVESFSTDSLDSGSGSGEVKVADIKDEPDDGGGGVPIAVYGGIMIIIIIIAARRRKKKKQ